MSRENFLIFVTFFSLIFQFKFFKSQVFLIQKIPPKTHNLWTVPHLYHIIKITEKNTLISINYDSIFSLGKSIFGMILPNLIIINYVTVILLNKTFNWFIAELPGYTKKLRERNCCGFSCKNWTDFSIFVISFEIFWKNLISEFFEKLK